MGGRHGCERFDNDQYCIQVGSLVRLDPPASDPSSSDATTCSMTQTPARLACEDSITETALRLELRIAGAMARIAAVHYAMFEPQYCVRFINSRHNNACLHEF